MGTDSMTYRYQNGSTSSMLNSLSSSVNVPTSTYAATPTTTQWVHPQSVPSSCHLYYQQQQQQQHWAKYYHTSPKRYYHYRHFAGKSLKDGSEGEKKDGDGDGLWAAVEAQAAFLGPNIWDKNLTACDSDLKYVDLDEFLSENGIPLEQPMTGGPPQQQQPSSPTSATVDGGGEGSSSSGGLRRGAVHPMELHINTSSSSDTKRERSASPYDPPLSPSTVGPPSPTDSTMSFSSTGREFDPRTRTFSDEELKPQPMIKKSRKQGIYKRDGSKIVDRRDSKKFVPDDLKDEKYWARRRKNNLAAKRSRDARRVKENQIALRAGFLEKENLTLKQEVERLKKENSSLRSKLEKSAPKSN